MPDARLGYAGHRGIPELRTAIAEYLARVRGVVVEPDQVLVCCAASQALTVIWDVLRQRGVRRVAIEDPGWRWQRYTVEHAGLEAVPVRVDADGLVVSELAAADVDAVVITPAHQYPTGVVMTAERRSALLAWAQQRQALIVEDDYDVEYRFGREPVASLQGLAPDRVAFVGTTSKTLAPALRLAWMVPPAGLLDEAEQVLMVTGVTPPTLDQLALATFIGDAALERHLRSMRRRYRGQAGHPGRCAAYVPARGPDQRYRRRPAPAGSAPGRRGRARASRCGPAKPGSACTNCTGTAPRGRPPPRPCCWASRCRARLTCPPRPGCWPGRCAQSRNRCCDMHVSTYNGLMLKPARGGLT